MLHQLTCETMGAAIIASHPFCSKMPIEQPNREREDSNIPWGQKKLSKLTMYLYCFHFK